MVHTLCNGNNISWRLFLLALPTTYRLVALWPTQISETPNSKINISGKHQHSCTWPSNHSFLLFLDLEGWDPQSMLHWGCKLRSLLLQEIYEREFSWLLAGSMRAAWSSGEKYICVYLDITGWEYYASFVEDYKSTMILLLWRIIFVNLKKPSLTSIALTLVDDAGRLRQCSSSRHSMAHCKWEWGLKSFGSHPDDVTAKTYCVE